MKKINTEQTKVNKTPAAESMNHLTEENLNILLKAMKIGFYKDFHRKGLLTDEQLASADTNGDGKVTIEDATHLQMYLAEYGVLLGKHSYQNN